MVQAWKMDPSCSQDQREEHKFNPNIPVTLDELQKIGVEYFKIPVNITPDGTYVENPELTAIKEKRGYSYEDDISISKEKLPNYEEKIKSFFEEHLHADEEIRYCLEGSGYFDVRDLDDKWIRIALVPGDLIVLPCGIYHRFTLDKKNYIRAKRFFVGEPVWTPHNRPYDDSPARKSYLQTFGKAGVKA